MFVVDCEESQVRAEGRSIVALLVEGCLVGGGAEEQRDQAAVLVLQCAGCPRMCVATEM